MTVVIVAKGLDKELKLLDEMKRRLNDLTPVMAGRAQTFETMIRKDVFGREQAPDGSPWKPLADSTIDRRRNKRKASIKILQDTRKMYSSIFAKGTERGIVFGSTDQADKVNANLFGSQKRPDQPPARPFLPVLPDGSVVMDGGPAAAWRERTEQRIRQYVEKGTV